jgi:hypothetical protein
MKPITAKEVALLQELSAEFARLSDNMNSLLTNVMDRQIRSDDPAIFEIKYLSEKTVAKAMQKTIR